MKKLILSAAFSLAASSILADGYNAPEAILPPSAFTGVHGLAIDSKGRLLAGTVLGNQIWSVDQTSGDASVFIDGPVGQADDIAIGPKGELVWTSFLQGVLRMRVSDDAEIIDLATGLPGINSAAFDQKSGRLFASQVFLADGLYEIDPTGATEPRLIAEGMGGFNGFEVGADGMLYGPLWFKGQVAKINPDSGEITIIADGFAVPAAVNFDSKGSLWVVDTKAGELVQLDPATGEKGRVVPMATSMDNLAIDADDNIFVSNMADHSITQVNGETGETRVVISGKAAVPTGLKLSEDGKTLYFADAFAMRSLDTTSGEVTDYRRMQESDLEYPFAVGLSADYVLGTSWFTNTVQVFNRADMSTAGMAHGFAAPTDALVLADGSLLVTEIATGNLVQASGEDWGDKTPVVTGLQGPVQIIKASNDMLYVTEAAGRISQVDPQDWSMKTIAEGLTLPEGLAELPDGNLVVAEAAAGRLTKVDISTGETTILVTDLPIGLEAGPGLPPTYLPTGLAVDADGTIYVAADRNNAIYRITPE
ncbi:sugar lactone lactonase YvrE [Sulfitobacter undariae]|uniref:Sugar lactone lactonase YvrE n=1 Tax=Sulfitobacter undariae TaxID=1563671 RepID=A0A7W6E297_9RHOB|nr:SMP-30/gluconolactonase/LRE family protein [Sulfitobacter undariae]MBB3993398.1 sugar lactone lactonase YvrE [Sulfitobacter undariae]